MSKKELIAEAKALDIKGASGMKVADLERAIAKATGSPNVGGGGTCPVCTRTHPHQHE